MKVGDRIIYTRDNWMGGIKSGAEEIPGYISKINLVKGVGGVDLLLYDLVREIDGKKSESPLAYGVFESEVKEIIIPKTCGICRFWKRKSSTEHTGQR